MITVDRGAELLDKRKRGWFKRINTEALNLESCQMCVLGQLYGDYADGLDALGIDWDDGKRFGFVAWSGYWENLNAAWARAIERRRAP